MTSLLRRSALCASLLVFVATAAHADRRYFVQSYTPYVAPEGNLELETHSIAKSGQGDSTGTEWQNRIELEYGITDRLTGAAYLNFIQPSGEGAAMTFDGPSIELIYRLADPGKLVVDPAAYLEVRANGPEVEVEPKLILGKRIYQLVSTVNIIGEFERISAGEDKGTTEKQMFITAGVSREIGHAFAFGIEAVYAHQFLDEGPDASNFLLGPTINWQSPKVQLALGWHPQISGDPATGHGLNLADFPRSEVRLIVGVEL